VVQHAATDKRDVTEVLLRLPDFFEEGPESASMLEPELVEAIQDLSSFYANSAIDEQQRSRARRSIDPFLLRAIVEFSGVFLVAVVVHADRFAPLLVLCLDHEAFDGDLLGFDEQVCVDVVAKFERELFEVARVRGVRGVCHVVRGARKLGL
jgi:hypothetical protein